MTTEQEETVRALLAANDAALRSALINTQQALRMLAPQGRPQVVHSDEGGWLGDAEPEDGK